MSESSYIMTIRLHDESHAVERAVTMSTQPSDGTPRMRWPTALAGNVDPPWHGIPTAIARRFHQICAARSSEVVGEFGLTPLQYGVTLHLDRVTGKSGIEQNVLADRVNVDRNTASLLVEQLVKMGIVARQVNGADRRVRLLSLTPQGKRLYARLRPAFVAANDDILSSITARERKLLLGLLIRVIEENLLRPRSPSHRRKQSRRQSPATKS
jgi:DNA-binding MarR family transcriptional regulator